MQGFQVQRLGLGLQVKSLRSRASGSGCWIYVGR